MKKFFKSSAEKRAEKQQKMLGELGKKFKTLDVMEKRGLIAYDPSEKRLFITTVLANIYLQSAEVWKAFLSNVSQWAIYNRQQEAWKALFQKKEIEEVRAAKKKYPILSKAEIQIIRQKARMAVDVSEIPAPSLPDFEFFITDLSSSKTPIAAVGHFDGEDFEMETYESVKRYMQPKDDVN